MIFSSDDPTLSTFSPSPAPLTFTLASFAFSPAWKLPCLSALSSLTVYHCSLLEEQSAGPGLSGSPAVCQECRCDGQTNNLRAFKSKLNIQLIPVPPTGSLLCRLETRVFRKMREINRVILGEQKHLWSCRLTPW